MPEDKLDSIADIPAIERETSLIIKSLTQIETAVKGLQGMQVAIFGNQSASGAAENQNQLVKIVNSAKAAEKDYVNWWKQALKEKDAASKASRAAEISGTKEILALQKEVEKQNRASAAAANNKVAIDSNIALSRTLKDLRDGYDRLTAAERSNENIGGALLNRIQELDKQLKITDATTGRFQRNVGDYSGGLNNLNFAVKNIASELPNAGISLRTFGMSISNNITPLIEAIKGVNAQNAIIAKDGGKPVSVLKTLGASLGSVSVISGIAVVGLLKLIEVVEKGNKADQEAAKSKKKYEDAINSVDETERASAQQQIARLNILTTLAQDNAQSTRTRTLAVEELQKTYPSVFGNLSKQTILEGDLNSAIRQTTQALLDRAAAQAAEKKFAASSELVYDLTLSREKAVEQLRVAESKFNAFFTQVQNNQAFAARESTATILNSFRKRVVSSRESLAEIDKQLVNSRKEQTRYLKDAQENAAKAGDILFGNTKTSEEKKKPAKDKADPFTDEKQAIEAQKAIAENEEMTYAQRYDAAVKYSQLSDQLLQKQNQHSIDNITIYAIEADKLFKKINDDRAAEEAANLRKAQESSKEIMTVIIDQMNNISQNENVAREKDLKALSDDLSNRQISLSQYNQEKERINAEYDEKILINQKDALNDYLSTQGLLPTEIAKIQETITNIENAESNRRIAQAEKEAKLKYDAEQKLSELQKQLVKDVTEFLLAAYTRRFDKQLSGLKTEQEEQQKKYENEKDGIQQSTLAEEEKTNRLLVLDAKQKEFEEKIKEQQDEINHKRDIAERIKANADIITATLIAEVQALTYLSNPITTPLYPGIASAIAALGAANLATLNATPLPEYEQGKKTSDPYEGYAWISEHGQTEKRIKPDGTQELYTQPTLIYTKRGDRILSNTELKSVETNIAKPETILINDYQEMIRAYSAVQQSQKKNDKMNTAILVGAIKDASKNNINNFLRNASRS